MRKTTTTFVHAGDVEGPVARHVTGDLRVADEGAVLATVIAPLHVLPLSVERRNEEPEAALTHVKVVPGNIHVPEEGRGWVVVRPARLAVVAAARVNAKMGPAIWVRRIGGLKPAQGAAAALPSSQTVNQVPSWLVVQNNRIAKGIAGRGL